MLIQKKYQEYDYECWLIVLVGNISKLDLEVNQETIRTRFETVRKSEKQYGKGETNWKMNSRFSRLKV